MPKVIVIRGGYTLIEVLVAFAIFGAVAVPLALFLSSTAARSTNDALLDAAQIARNRMEVLIAEKDFSNVSDTEKIGTRLYSVETTCQANGSLLEVYIKVKKPDDIKIIFTLYRSFYVPAQAS
jgi:type II secretion system protein I